MQRSFAVAFAVIALAMTIGFDFFQRQANAKSTGESFGVADYFGGLKERYAATKAEETGPDIAQYAPISAEDWTKRKWTDADLERFYGPAYDLTPEERQQAGNGQGASDSLSFKLASASNTGDIRRDTQVYQTGATTIAVSMAYKPENISTETSLAQFGAMQDSVDLNGARADFARVGGVLFSEYPQESGTPSRRFSGQIGPQIDIDLRLIGGNAEAVEILAGIDFDGLNTIIKNSVKGVGNAQEIAFLLQDDGSVATVAVKASIMATTQKLLANRAAALLVVEEEKRNLAAEETAVKLDTKREKPKVRRMGSGNCSGKTFKRCSVTK